MPFGFISGAIGVASGLKGLFGKKKKDPTPKDNIISQARGVRQAAEESGFNPLTMLQYGQPGGAMGSGGGHAPLASIDLITGGLKDISDAMSGDKERQQKREELEQDLLRVQIDQLRSGVLAAPPAAAGIGAGPSPIGRRPAVQAQSAGSAPKKLPVFGSPTPGPNTIAPGRGQEIDPVVNSSGIFEMENVLTGGRPITIPGEGEPWGIDELATAVVVGAPQILGGLGNKLIYDGKSFSERMEAYREREKEELGKAKKSRKVYDGPGGPVYLPN